MAVKNEAKKTGKSTASRKVVTYRKGNFTGYVYSRLHERQIQYESILERDFIYLLESDPGVKSYQEQPDPFAWNDGTTDHNTTFDFFVTRASGEYYVEVKPLAVVIKKGLTEIYGHAKAAARAAGKGFELWTDRELKAIPRLPNAEITVGTNTSYNEEAYELAIETVVHEAAKTTDRVTVRELRARLPREMRTQSYREVMRMVALRKLIPADETAFLGDDAVLLIPGGKHA